MQGEKILFYSGNSKNTTFFLVTLRSVHVKTPGLGYTIQVERYKNYKLWESLLTGLKESFSYRKKRIYKKKLPVSEE